MRIFLVISFLGLLLQLAGGGPWGCSTATRGAEAPPVSLPAPITGRITVTSPDEDGTALVVGDEGAVTGGSLVHVTNTTEGGSALLLFSDLFPSAMAQASLPAICSRTFHACGTAEEDGSFEIEITAAEDDAIEVELLDASTGTTISEKSSHQVPHNIRFFVRAVQDVGLLPQDQKLYAVMASNVEDPNGLISVVNTDTGLRNTVSFDGAAPFRIVTHEGTATAAVLDAAGNFAALVDLAANNFDAPPKAPILAPRDAVFSTDGTLLYVSTANTLAVGGPVRRIDPSGPDDLGLVITNGALDAVIAGASNSATRGLDLFSFETAFGSTDILVFVGLYDVGGTERAALGMIDPNAGALLDFTLLPEGTDPVDVAAVPGLEGILVTDQGNGKILVFSYVIDMVGPGATATLTGRDPITDPEGVVINPKRIVVDETNGLAYVTAKNGNETHFDTVLTVDLGSLAVVDLNPVGLNPSGIVWDGTTSILYVGTLKTRAVTFWDLPTLLP